jgi:dynein heavy chain, axonemal
MNHRHHYCYHRHTLIAKLTHVFCLSHILFIVKTSGGHITDDWDRRLCRTYLSTQMQESLLDGAELFPGFPVPPSSLRYEEYLEYVETSLPSEGPVAFGLHLNAEIGFLTQQGETLLRTIFELQPRTVVAGGGESIEERAKAILDDILERIPEEDFNLPELSERLEDDRSPFQIVFYQECERMNILCGVIRRTLQELDLGLKGDLSISENMELVMHSLFLDRVPEAWEHAAYPSLRPLGAWVVDLLERYNQLADWAADLQLPRVVWISGFFNPQSYLTAIMQQTARKNTWPLDRMTLVTDLTRKQPDEIDALPREGVYIRGVSLEGARWDIQSGWMDEAKLKELTPALPVMHIKAQLIDKADFRGYYECPLYRTQERGPTFISTFHLKTRMPSEHWIICGVALLLEAV